MCGAGTWAGGDSGGSGGGGGGGGRIFRLAAFSAWRFISSEQVNEASLSASDFTFN